ncbi:MAG: hypothetical protein MUE60_14950 [Candidatus Eisenbacteria bacterium]|nr:hypothetical protein [Candidatus Eisenbacteria bacterium]
MPLVSKTWAHQDQYVSDLRSAYLGLRLDDPDHAFVQDPLIWDKMLRDPVIWPAVQHRCYAISGRKWQLRPPTDSGADKAAAGVIAEILGQVHGFTVARHRLAQAVFHEGSSAFTNGQRRYLGVRGFPILGLPEPPHPE